MKSFTKLLLLALTSLVAGNATASPVTAEQARQAAREFFAKSAPRKARAAQNLSALSLAYEAKTSASTDFYVFNLDNNAGYVIASADNAAPAVLAYADEGTFDPNNIPDNMRWWLTQYQREMRIIKANPQAAPRRPISLTTSVEPLVRTMWNQDAPYNNNCPTYTGYDNYGQSYTDNCATGCVATAVAQIMNYHRWPATGTGSISYSKGGYSLSCNFAQSNYDWDNMLYAYGSKATTAQNNAVAKLMSDVGIGCRMEYGQSSGAYTSDAVTALKNYFRYDTDLLMLSRSKFGINSWEQLLREELDARRPVYYAGSATDGGHAFVFDGYNTDGYFHVNWGWGGASNGYFLVSILNPDDQGIGSFDGGYNDGQEVIVGIKPNDGVTGGDILFANYASASSTSSSVSLGSSTTLRMTSFKLYGNKRWSSLYLGVRLMNADETAVVAQSPQLSKSSLTLNSTATTASMTYTVPTNLAAGTYHLYFTYTTDSDDPRVCATTGTISHLVMTVANNKATFSTPSTALQLVNLTPNSTQLYAERPFSVTATVKNNGADYFNNFTLRLKKGSTTQTGDAFKVGIPTGESVTFTTQMTAPKSTGTYTLGLYDNNGNLIGDTQNVTVSAAGTTNLSIATRLTPKATVMPSDDVQATVKIKNNATTPYMGVFEMFILPTSGNSILGQLFSDVVTIAAGATATISFKGEFGGEVGTNYLMSMRDPKYPNDYYPWGASNTFQVSGLQPNIVKEVPVMNPVDASTITDTGFRADWTAVDNVTSYNLQVDKTSGSIATIFTETFAKCTKSATTQLTATTLNNLTDNQGWVGSYVYQEVGGLRLGSTSYNGNLASPQIDLSGSAGKVVVLFDAVPYKNATGCQLRLYTSGYSDSPEVVNIADSIQQEYRVTLDSEEADAQRITIQTVTAGKNVIVKNIRILSADNGSSILFEGITGNSCNVTGLEPGQSYKYKVQAVYTDETTSAWSNIETVTLTGSVTIPGDVNNDGEVNIADINIMTNVILGIESMADYPAADLNNNGEVEISDLNILINITLEAK